MSQRAEPHAQQEVSEKVFRKKFEPQTDHVSGHESDGEPRYRPRVSLLRRSVVEARTGLSRSTIYDWMKRGEFPKPVKLGDRLVAWRESDVTAWIESRETRTA